ncbi:MAG: CHAP domain-containing protein [Candidatus Riflebacteria bacterium]|nr:CHAP domain-containing protein [Candidatus Riflebacteria bacterium]
MKTRILSLPVLLVIALIFGIIGCWNGGGNGDNPVGPVPSNNPGPGNSSAGTAQSVQFRIVLPAQTAAPVPLAGIRATGASGTPTVTFKLTLVNVGVATQPTITLLKTVPVNGSGMTEASFSNIPVMTAIGDIHIEGGRVGSYSDFHGAADLLASVDNVILLAPRGSRLTPDLVAEGIDRLTSSSALFSKVIFGLASRLNQSASEIDPQSSTVVDDLIAAYTRFFEQLPVMSGATTSMHVEAPVAILPVTFKLTTMLGETAIASGGTDVVVPGQDAAPLIAAIDDSGRPFLLGFGGSSPLANMKRRPGIKGSILGPVMDAESTARALVSIFPLLGGTDRVGRNLLLQEIFASSEFTALVTEINNQLAAGNRDYLGSGSGSQVYAKVVAAVTPAINRRRLNASARFGVRADVFSKAPVLDQNCPGFLSFSNDSYIYYDVTSSQAIFNHGIFAWKWWFLPGKSGWLDFSITSWPPITVSGPEVSLIPVAPGQADIQVSKSNFLNGLKALGIVLDLFGAELVGKALDFKQDDIELAQDILEYSTSFVETFDKMQLETTTVGAFGVFINSCINNDKIILIVQRIIKRKFGLDTLTTVTARFLNIWCDLAKNEIENVLTAPELVNEGIPFFKDWIGAEPGYTVTINKTPTPTSTPVEAPKVLFTTPLDGSKAVRATDIILQAAATPGSGRTIARVDFYDGDVKRGEAATSPYSMTLLAIDPGTHALKAAAVDNVGVTGESAVVQMIVDGNTHGLELGEYDGVKIRANGFVEYNDSRLKAPTQFPFQERWHYNTEINGVNTGMEWECVEFVNRYYLVKFERDIRGSGGNAESYYRIPVDHGLVRFANDGTGKPQIGDILVSTGLTASSPGHVAIVTEVTDAYVRVVHQNYTNTKADADGSKLVYFESGKLQPFDGAQKLPVAGWARLGNAPALPLAPTSVVAEAGDGKVTLHWTNPADALSNNVYWSTSAGVSQGSSKLGARPNPCSVTGLKNGAPYYFVVTAIGVGGESQCSSEVTAAPKSSSTPSPSPTPTPTPTPTPAPTAAAPSISNISPNPITADRRGRCCWCHDSESRRGG